MSALCDITASIPKAARERCMFMRHPRRESSSNDHEPAGERAVQSGRLRLNIEKIKPWGNQKARIALLIPRLAAEYAAARIRLMLERSDQIPHDRINPDRASFGKIPELDL